MIWLLDRLFGKRLKTQTERYLKHLAEQPEREARASGKRLLALWRAAPGGKVVLGTTEWNEAAEVPVGALVSAHGLVTGGTGAGKTMLCLVLLEGLLEDQT